MKKTKKALIVEDSPTQAMRVQSLLEGAGLRVIVAHNGKAGIQLARQLIPEVIILDLEMPELNGFQVCEQLKQIETTAEIPIILFTRHDDREAVLLGLQVGAIEFIPKDAFADAVLLETLRQMEIIESRE